MCWHFLLRILFRQKSLITVVSFVCFLLLGWVAHAKEMRKITTPHFSIGFDTSMARAAQRIANTLETLYEPVSKTLGVHPSPVRLVINNQSTRANGWFTSMPRRMLFYSFYNADPHFVGNTDWLTLLCIHEFRHAVQHSIEYHSTPLLLRPLYFWGNMAFLFGVVPFFKEGDAVGIETALSKSGRGRLPGWERLYKVNLLERSEASFGRQLFGSLQHEMPDHYRLGYYFSTHIRRRYGAQAIKAIYEKSIRGVPFFGFYNAVKEVTKKPILKVYKEMHQELLLGWQKQLEGLNITPATQLTIKKPADSFDYLNPFMDASGNLIAWKSGIGLRYQLVMVGSLASKPIVWNKTLKKTPLSFRKDKVIVYVMYNNLPPVAFAIGEGCAAWLEECMHPWQGKRSTMRLQYYDFKQKKRRTLVQHSRYGALAMSPSTHQLVAVTSDDTAKHYLVVLETKSGKVIKKIDNPDDGYYVTPSWCGEDHVVVVKTKEQQNSIVRVNVATSQTEILLPGSYEHRNSPKIYKDYLLYNSSYNGIDNIYAMHLPTKACFQVTSRKYGAYLGMVDPVTSQLVFSDYTKNGMEIAVMPFDPLSWTPLEKVEDRSVRYYEPLVVQEQNGDILAQVPNHVYPLTKYRAVKDSLAFTGINVDPKLPVMGFKVVPISLSSLDNFNATPYFYHQFKSNKIRKDYNRQKISEIGLKIDYQTSYPIFNAHISGRRYKIFPNRGGKDRSGQQDLTYWGNRLGLGMELPYYFALGSSAGKVFLHASAILRPSRDGIDFAQKYCFNIKNNSTQSKRDIQAPWSQGLNITLKDRTFNRDAHKNQNKRSIGAEFYFPGIGQHHYFGVHPSISWRIPTITQLTLEDRLLFNRLQASQSLCKRAISFRYGFPLVYPECGIPLIWFLQKVSMEGYYDYGHTLERIQMDQIGKMTHSTFEQVDVIGTRLNFSYGLLSTTTLCFSVCLDFSFYKESNSGWRFCFKPSICLLQND